MTRRPYSLTLTQSERNAIMHVGDRYAHGDDLYDILTDIDFEAWTFHDTTGGPDPSDWGFLADGDITFHFQEHEAWAVAEIQEENGDLWDLFSDELRDKFRQFIMNIV